MWFRMKSNSTYRAATQPLIIITYTPEYVFVPPSHNWDGIVRSIPVKCVCVGVRVSGGGGGGGVQSVFVCLDVVCVCIFILLLFSNTPTSVWALSFRTLKVSSLGKGKKAF